MMKKCAFLSSYFLLVPPRCFHASEVEGDIGSDFIASSRCKYLRCISKTNTLEIIDASTSRDIPVGYRRPFVRTCMNRAFAATTTSNSAAKKHP